MFDLTYLIDTSYPDYPPPILCYGTQGGTVGIIMVAANFRPTRSLFGRISKSSPRAVSSFAVYLLEKRWALLRNERGGVERMRWRCTKMEGRGRGIFRDRVFNLDFDLRAKEEGICVYDIRVEGWVSSWIFFYICIPRNLYLFRFVYQSRVIWIVNINLLFNYYPFFLCLDFETEYFTISLIFRVYFETEYFTISLNSYIPWRNPRY